MMKPVAFLTRYIPPLAPDPVPAEAEVESAEDLERIEWIHAWSRKPGFRAFRNRETAGGHPLLAAEYENGASMPVGYLSERLPWL